MARSAVPTQMIILPIQEAARLDNLYKGSLHQPYALLASSDWQHIIRNLVSLGGSSATELTVRHAMISEFSTNSKSLGHGAPMGENVGAMGEYCFHGAWMGVITGGWMVERVEGNLSYIVYVGWESIEVHDSYHNTKHFRQRAIILSERLS
ncbi:hypothetical protein N7486_002591 [Penicillium sp. IBT 16267x]|nr:hypothetical protein N7486_002591 [Penicillium sp. IBT 16267x]